MTRAGLPGAPPRPSQRRARPARVLAAAPLFSPGDTVKWNDRYQGTILELLGDEALVKEIYPPLGGDRQWRLELAALKRVLGR
jgi:hypothetical protein